MTQYMCTRPALANLRGVGLDFKRVGQRRVGTNSPVSSEGIRMLTKKKKMHSVGHLLPEAGCI